MQHNGPQLVFAESENVPELLHLRFARHVFCSGALVLARLVLFMPPKHDEQHPQRRGLTQCTCMPRGGVVVESGQKCKVASNVHEHMSEHLAYWVPCTTYQTHEEKCNSIRSKDQYPSSPSTSRQELRSSVFQSKMQQNRMQEP